MAASKAGVFAIGAIAGAVALHYIFPSSRREITVTKAQQKDIGLGYTSSKPHVLVTGGSGYLGTHMILVLLNGGYEVTVIDNFCNSSPIALERVKSLTSNGDFLHVIESDIRDEVALDTILGALPPIHACYHLAGLKAVGESVEEPLSYYDNNVGGTIKLLSALHKHGCRKFIFSSSATVYGDAAVPITEDSPVGQGITNPYGRSKYIVEEVLKDFSKSPKGKDWGIMILRYFNPVGAHPSGLIGEDPNGPPNNLMPYVCQVAVGRRPHLTVFGDDYDTVDGTGVRDYIHVMDLAEAHLTSLQHLEGKTKGEQVTEDRNGLHIYNLGSGSGYSVLQMVEAMRKASGQPIPVQVGPRRAGDLATVFADPSRCTAELGWTVARDLGTMCTDMWKWQESNPQGYGSVDENPDAAALVSTMPRVMTDIHVNIS